MSKLNSALNRPIQINSDPSGVNLNFSLPSRRLLCCPPSISTLDSCLSFEEILIFMNEVDRKKWKIVFHRMKVALKVYSAALK